MKHQIRVTPAAAGLFAQDGAAAVENACGLSGGWGKALAIVLVMAISCLVATAAIDRGNIQGTVADEQNAVIPGARVVVKNLDTNVEVALTTNNSGVYQASELVPGRYSVRVEARGFSPVEVTNVRVAANSTVTTDVQMKLGTTSQTVSVSAEAPVVEDTPSNFTTAALDSRAISDLPLVGRDIQTLVQLVPGITQSSGPSGSVFGFNSQFGGFPDPLHLVGSTVSANGSQGGANAWYLDGSLNAALGAENAVVVPSPSRSSTSSTTAWHPSGAGPAGPSLIRC